jgi:5'-deoxynucleotidase YfbR-like HD superfamily hydrolase
MTTQRAWVRLYSGKRLDLLNPTPFDWDDSDLALGLARTYRWGGHSAWPLPLSVAQHSLFVLALHRASMRNPSTPCADLRELLHDADEGLLGFDCISVVKPFLGEAFRHLSERLQGAINLRYGLEPFTEAERKRHKRADRVAAASEAVHIVGWTAKEVRATLKIPFEPLIDDPLAAIYGSTPWEPWPPALAAERFLAELERLTPSGVQAGKSSAPISQANQIEGARNSPNGRRIVRVRRLPAIK